MKKRLLSTFMALTLMLGMLPTAVFATEDDITEDVAIVDVADDTTGASNSDGTLSLAEQVEVFASTPSTVDADGDATAVIGQDGNPFKIGNATVLQELADLVADEATYGSYSYGSAHYVLSDDIDMSGKSWDAIEGFTGSFDGDGFVIYYFEDTDHDADYEGVFGTLGTNGTVSNLLATSLYKDALWDGTSATEPTSTEITTAAELAYLATLTTFSGTYTLTTDIDLGGKTNWTPIGDYSNNFTGSFDGDGYEIIGLYIDSNAGYQGLFGYSTGAIKNLTVSGSVSAGATSSNSYAGGIVGYNDGGTVTNCVNHATVSATGWYAGGIVGINKNDGTVSYCENTGDITSSSGSVGGIVGNTTGSVTYCYNSGYVSGEQMSVGGIVGCTDGSTSYDVKYNVNTGDVSGGGAYVGGIVGNQIAAKSTVSHNVSLGATVTSTASYTSVGAVVDDSTTGTVENNYAWSGMTVSSTSESDLTGENGTSLYYIEDTGFSTDDSSATTWATIFNNDPYWTGDITEMPNGDAVPSYISDGASSSGSGDTVTPTDDLWTSYAATELAASNQISTAAELAYFASQVNAGTTYSGVTITLAADIDLSDHEWVAIGTFSNPFQGTFDGDGYKITGLTIDSDSDYQGLFGYVSGATIQNLTVYGSVTGANYTAGIVGYNNNSDITNCVNYATVSSTGCYVGGVVGQNYASDSSSSISMENCVNYGDVESTNSNGYNGACVGGVVGRSYASGTIIMTYCANYGDVTAFYDNTGGIIGSSYAGTNSVTIEYCYNTGAISGTTYVGGVIGYNQCGSNTSNATVQYCYNTGAISGTTYVGGVVGENYGTSGSVTVQYCYNTGSVSGTSHYAGGIVGYNYAYNESSSATVSNVYNTGSVSGKKYTGGVVGQNYTSNENSSATVSNAYNTGNVSGTGYVGGVVGVNTGYGTTTVSNCVSLANTVTGTSNVGRVIGENDGTAETALYAWSGTNSDVTSENAVDGADLYYASATGFATDSSEFDWTTICPTSDWTEASDDTYQLPSLMGEISQNPLANITFVTVTFEDVDGEEIADFQITSEGSVTVASTDLPGNYAFGIVGDDGTISAWDDTTYYVDTVIQAVSAEASVGNTSYTTIELAIAAANDETDATVKLLQDVEIEAQLEITASMTLDLNGFDIAYNNSESNESVLYVNTSSTDEVVTLTDSDSTDRTRYGYWSATEIEGDSSFAYAVVDSEDDVPTDTSYDTIYGGMITGGTGYGLSTSYYGGGVYINKGTFTMDSGNIVGNTCIASYGYGGGVYVKDGTIFNMSGGTITGNGIHSTKNSTLYGGGVYVSGGTVTMTGGTIASNKALRGSSGGGAVGITSDGTFTMSGTASITGNTSAANGGAVYITDSTGSLYSSFIMTGGSITGNTANYYGGAVYMKDAYAKLDISGGEISGNTASNAGSNVYFYAGTMNISGNPVLGSDTSEGVYLNTGKYMTITGNLTTGASIYFTTTDSGDNAISLDEIGDSVTFATASSGYTAPTDTFHTATAEGLDVIHTSDSTYTHSLIAVDVHHCDENCPCYNNGNAIPVYNEASLIAAMTAEGTTSYAYLAADIEIENTITVTGPVSLCLNGHSVTYVGDTSYEGSYYVFKLDSSTATLNLYDCDDADIESGSIKGGKSAVYIGTSGGTFNMYGGTITGNDIGVNIQSAGTMNMYGGTITNNEDAFTYEEIDIYVYGTMNVSGSPVVGSVYVYNTSTSTNGSLNVTGDLTEDARIGVINISGTLGTVTSGKTVVNSNFYVVGFAGDTATASDGDEITDVINSDGTLRVADFIYKTNAMTEVEGDDMSSMPTIGAFSTWFEVLTDSTSLETMADIDTEATGNEKYAGYYVLNDEYTGDLSISTGKNIYLHLNGNEFSGAITTSGSLEVFDDSTGKISGDITLTDTKVTLYCGEISSTVTGDHDSGSEPGITVFGTFTGSLDGTIGLTVCGDAQLGTSEAPYVYDGTVINFINSDDYALTEDAELYIDLLDAKNGDTLAIDMAKGTTDGFTGACTFTNGAGFATSYDSSTGYITLNGMNVDDDSKIIYANGLNLVITAGTTGTSTVFWDEDGDGVCDTDEIVIKEDSDLSEWTIYGGSKDADVDSSNITINGGDVDAIYLGGSDGTVTTANLDVDADVTGMEISTTATTNNLTIDIDGKINIGSDDAYDSVANSGIINWTGGTITTLTISTSSETYATNLSFSPTSTTNVQMMNNLGNVVSSISTATKFITLVDGGAYEDADFVLIDQNDTEIAANIIKSGDNLYFVPEITADITLKEGTQYDTETTATVTLSSVDFGTGGVYATKATIYSGTAEVGEITLENGKTEYTEVAIDLTVDGIAATADGTDIEITFKVVYTLASGVEIADEDDLTIGEIKESVAKRDVTLTLSNTEATYDVGVNQKISITTDCSLDGDDFKVTYYEIKENSDLITSNLGTDGAISTGTYVYVIEFTDPTDANYYALGNTTIDTDNDITENTTKVSDVVSSDNAGYFIISTSAGDAQDAITFATGLVNEKTTDGTYTQVVANPNANATTTYAISGGSATIHSTSGEVTFTEAGYYTITATSKKDGTTDVTATYYLSVTNEKLTITASDTSVDYGDAVPAYAYTAVGESGGAVTFTTEPIVTSSYSETSKVGQYNITVSGAVASGYDITYVAGTLTVSEKVLTATDLTFNINDKTFDNGTTATGTGSYAGDSALTVNFTANFADAAVGTAKDVTISNISFSGTTSANYTIASDATAEKTAAITAASVSISCASNTTATYDGDAKSVNVIAIAMVNGFDDSKDMKVWYEGTDYTKSTDAPRAVGTYTVTVEITNANFTTSFASATLTIKEASQDSFTIEGVPDSVSYGDTFTVSTTATGSISYSVTGNATITDAGLVTVTGTGSITITATSTADNYTAKTVTKTFTAKAKELSFTATATNKTYDGDTAVDVTIALTNKVGSDAVTASATGTMVTADAGSGKLVYVTGIALDGTAKDNYTIAETAQTTVTIAKAEITAFTITAEGKVYDGTTDASATVENITGVLEGDDVTILGSASFDSADVTTATTVTYTASGLSGTSASNYELKATSAEASASITAMPITFAVGTTSFVYDGEAKTVEITAHDSNNAVVADTNYTVSGNTGTTVGSSYQVVISNLNSNYSTTSSLTYDWSIVNADQSALTITNIKGTVSYGDEFTLGTAGGTTDATITWESDNAGVAITENGGVVTVSGAVNDYVTITATATADNYNDQTATWSFVPTAKTVSFTLSNTTATYDSTTQEVTVGTDTGVTYTTTYNGSETLPTNAGTYSVYVVATGNYSGQTFGTLTIEKADFTDIGVSATGGTYTGSAYEATADASNGVTPTLKYSTLDGTAPTDAGTYTVVATYEDANYETATASAPFTIAKATLTVTANDQTRTYGESNPELTVSYDGFVNGEDKTVLIVEPTARTIYGTATAVDTYEDAITVSGGSATNYTFTYVSGDLEVTAIGSDAGTLTISGTPYAFTVGDTTQLTARFGVEYPTIAWTTSDAGIISVDANGVITAEGTGSATITATVDDAAYGTGITATVTITVTAATQGSFDITSSNENPVYGDADFTLSTDATGTVTYVSSDETVATINGDTVTIVKPGTFTVTATSSAAGSTDKTKTRTFTIAKKDVTITANDVTMTYGDTFAGDGYTATDENVTGTATYATTYSETMGVGTYTITPSGLSSDYYDFDYEIGYLTVSAKTLTASDLTFTAADKTYDGTTDATGSTVAVNAEAIINGDALSVTATAIFDSATVGEGKTVNFTDLVLGGTKADNYSLTADITGTDTADITAATPGTLYLFGTQNLVPGEETTLTLLLDGTAPGYEVTWESSNTDVAIVTDGTVTAVATGSATITASLTDDSGNEITATIAITVTTRTVTLVPVSSVFTYNGTEQAVTFKTSAGVAFSDLDITYALSTDASETTFDQVGTYYVTAVSTDPNVDTSYTGQVTMNKASVEMTAVDATSTYGTAPTFTATGLLGDDAWADYADQFVFTCEADETSDVGTYDISLALAGTEDRNYIFTASETPATLTIGQKALIITVADVTREYAAENTDPVLSYTGFENGDDVAVLTGTNVFAWVDGTGTDVSVGTIADAVTASGYDADNGNYAVTYANNGKADLIVATQTVTFTAGTAKASYINVSVSKSITGLTASNFAISPAVSFTVTENSGTSYTLNGTFTVDTEYTITISGISSDYTLTADTLTVTPTSTSTSGGSSGGGGGSSTTTTTTTDTTTNDDGSVTATVEPDTTTVSGITTATVDDDTMDDAIETAVAEADGEATHVEIVVDTKTSTDTVEVELSTDAITAVADSDVESLTITSDLGTIAIPSDALAEIASQATGDNIVITVQHLDTDEHLNDVQANVVGDALVIDLIITSNGEPITSFGGHEIEVSLPYELKDGEIAENIVVWYIDDLGNITPMETVYDAETETVTFTTPHFSIYAIIHDTNIFTDVDENAYYYDAVKWAVANSITSGTTDTTFSPAKVCTRAEAVMFLWNAAGEPEVSGDMIFTDVSADAYYYDAVLWAVENGITQGTSDTTFSPDETCTRSQIVTFLWNNAGNPVVNYLMTFTDVASDAWYAEAVRWAVSEGITSGTTDTTFSPDSLCDRGQIVTFLYRNLGE